MIHTPNAASGNTREERARELLAKALESHPNGYGSYARIVRNDKYSNTTLEAAITAILAFADEERAAQREVDARIADNNDNYGSCGGIKQDIARKIRAQPTTPGDEA